MPLNTNEKRALQIFVGRIRKIFGSRLISIKMFGSAVRDERWEESDIDILVLIDKLKWREKCRVFDWMSFLRKQESSAFKQFWIPAFAGMTKQFDIK